MIVLKLWGNIGADIPELRGTSKKILETLPCARNFFICEWLFFLFFALEAGYNHSELDNITVYIVKNILEYWSILVWCTVAFEDDKCKHTVRVILLNKAVESIPVSSSVQDENVIRSGWKSVLWGILYGRPPIWSLCFHHPHTGEKAGR